MVQAGATLVSKEARGGQSGKVRLKWAVFLPTTILCYGCRNSRVKEQYNENEKYRGYENENSGSRRGSLLSGRGGKEAALALELARSQNITNKPAGRPFYRYPEVAFSTAHNLTVSITNQRLLHMKST